MTSIWRPEKIQGPERYQPPQVFAYFLLTKALCRLRHALYMATLVATRRNPVIQAYYQRLVSTGKAKKVAIVACMRKLLTILKLWSENSNLGALTHQLPLDWEDSRYGMLRLIRNW